MSILLIVAIILLSLNLALHMHRYDQISMQGGGEYLLRTNLITGNAKIWWSSDGKWH